MSRSPLARWGVLALAFSLGLGTPPTHAADYTFTDVGPIAPGLKEHFGRAHAWGDLDGDGLWDLVTGSDDRGLMAFRQVAPMQFERVDRTNGLATSTALYGVLVLDFDRDGDQDVFLNLVGFTKDIVPSSTKFFRNDGTGHFVDATVAAGVVSYGHGFGLVALDYDRDGWVDVYVCNHEFENRLFRNNGDGTFSDVTATAGVGGVDGRRGRTTSAAALDFDRDGWMDLYVGQRDLPDSDHPTGNNKLYRNRGDGSFEDVAVAAGVAGIGDDFVVTVDDFDNDTWPDLYVSTFNFGPNGPPETNHPNRLYLNRGDGTFEDVHETSGADYVGGTMGCGSFDHDNDGWPDLYIGTGGPFVLQIEDQKFYRNLGGGRFIDETSKVGLLDDARGHGISASDLDRDGDLDIFSSMGGHTPESSRYDALYVNSGGPRHWLEVRLRGDDCPLEGIGAEVTLEAGAIRRTRFVLASGGFDSQAVPHVWFGLGDTTAVDRLLVRWPCGRTEVVTSPAVDQHLVVREGEYPLGLAEGEEDTREGVPGGSSLSVSPIPAQSVAILQVVGIGDEPPRRVEIYNSRGRRVRSLVLRGETRVAGAAWDLRDQRGRRVAPGKYFAAIEVRGILYRSSFLVMR